MSKVITNTIRHIGGSADNITLDNSQNVTVEGNATVDGTLQVGGDSGVAGTWHLEAYNGSGDGTAIVAGTTGAKIELRDTGSSEQFVLAANGDCNVYSYLNGDNISFHTTDGSGTTNRLKIRSNGDVDLETGSLVVATAGKGIMFHPHDETATSAGSDSNLLSDYEEGTYNPSWGGVTNTANHNEWLYRKVGNLVYVTGRFKCATTSNDGTTVHGTVPFTPASNPTNGYNTSVGAVMHKEMNTYSSGNFTSYLSTTTNLYFYKCQQNGDWDSLGSDDVAVNDEMIVSLTYITS